jgi:uncharacterized radical SAM superfamily Fe-S cluster-containing enzyme
MDGTKRTPTPARKDRRHTFLAHEHAPCPSCDARVDGRVVLRAGKVVNLLLCVTCGPQEILVSDDAGHYVEAFLARGKAPEGHPGDWLFKKTTSTCPSCLALLEAEVVIRDTRVFFKKDCKRCGPSEALVSEDARYHVQAYSFARAGTEPLEFTRPAKLGCPVDCGTCSDHEQHTCLPIIEVTDHCNLECPICIADNQHSSHMPLEVFERTIDGLIRAEGKCESVAICGGEPTSHPRVFELIRAADRPEIGRVVLITNGLRIGRDVSFVRQIKDSGAYVALQLDGFDAETHRVLRGRDLTEEKEAALRALKEFRIPTQLIFVAARGVNEHQIGQAVDLLLREEHILSLNFQPVAFTGKGGGRFAHDPMDRLTIPGVIEAVDRQTNGRIRKTDFAPLPCSHPQCVSLTYLLRLNDGTYLPFPRFIDLRKHGSLLRSSATLPATAEMHDILHEVIHDVFAREDEIDRGPDILAALRRALNVMFPGRPLSAREDLRIGETQAKSVFLHHYMDPHDFDLERLRKCCHHYARADGRIMPACGFNLFHRGAARGPGTAVPDWARSTPLGSGAARPRPRVLG